MCDMAATKSLMLRNNIIFKAPFGEHFRISYFSDKKVRVDNNENYAKNTYHVKPISNVSNVTLQITVQFYFFNSVNVNSSFHIFFQFFLELAVVKKRFYHVVFLNSFLSQR